MVLNRVDTDKDAKKVDLNPLVTRTTQHLDLNQRSNLHLPVADIRKMLVNSRKSLHVFSVFCMLIADFLAVLFSNIAMKDISVNKICNSCLWPLISR